MPVDGFATDGASDSVATFGVQHLCTTSLLPPALSPVASSPNSLRDTNGARLPRMENGLDIHPVAKSHCHEPRFSRKTPRSGWFLENSVSFHFGCTLSLLFGCFLFPRFEFCLSHPRCQRPFPQNSLLSVHSLFETVCGHGSFDKLFERIWQRFIYLSNFAARWSNGASSAVAQAPCPPSSGWSSA